MIGHLSYKCNIDLTKAELEDESDNGWCKIYMQGIRANFESNASAILDPGIKVCSRIENSWFCK